MGEPRPAAGGGMTVSMPVSMGAHGVSGAKAGVVWGSSIPSEHLLQFSGACGAWARGYPRGSYKMQQSTSIVELGWMPRRGTTPPAMADIWTAYLALHGWQPPVGRRSPGAPQAQSLTTRTDLPSAFAMHWRDIPPRKPCSSLVQCPAGPMMPRPFCAPWVSAFPTCVGGGRAVLEERNFSFLHIFGSRIRLTNGGCHSDGGWA